MEFKRQDLAHAAFLVRSAAPSLRDRNLFEGRKVWLDATYADPPDTGSFTR